MWIADSAYRLVGWFDPQLTPEGWFDDTLAPAGTQSYTYAGTIAAQSTVAGTTSRFAVKSYSGLFTAQSVVPATTGQTDLHTYAGAIAGVSGVAGTTGHTVTKAYSGILASAQSTVSSSTAYASTRAYAGTVAVQSQVSALTAQARTRAYASVVVSQATVSADRSLTKASVTGLALQSAWPVVYASQDVDDYAGVISATVQFPTTYSYTGALQHTYTGQIDAVADTSSAYSTERAYAGVVDAQGGFHTIICKSKIYNAAIVVSATSIIAAQSQVQIVPSLIPGHGGIGGDSSFEAGTGTYTLHAGAGHVLTSGSADVVYTPVAPVIPMQGGGGMSWPLPQRIRRPQKPARTRPDVLVHRTMAAAPGRVLASGTAVLTRFRRAVVTAGPDRTRAMAGPVRATFTRRIVGTTDHPGTANLSGVVMYRRALLTHSGQTTRPRSARVSYDTFILANTGTVETRGSAMRTFLSMHPRYAEMFADEEWLLMEVA